jgi:hypothetical protein
MKKLKQRNTKKRDAKLRQCYVYEIRVDGVVRYIGKGCNGVQCSRPCIWNCIAMNCCGVSSRMSWSSLAGSNPAAPASCEHG